MKIIICDRNVDFISEWHDRDGVDYICGDILDLDADAFVSPANSFGFMDGGIDYAYSMFFGWDLQHRLQYEISTRQFGELLVGEAILIPTNHKKVPWLISAPTMRVPKIIHDPADVYLASRAAVKSALDAGLSSVAFPGMGTGCGMMPFGIAANAMAKGIADGMLHPAAPTSWRMAQVDHFNIGSGR